LIVLCVGAAAGLDSVIVLVTGQGISAWVALNNVTVLVAAAVISGQGISTWVALDNVIVLVAAVVISGQGISAWVALDNVTVIIADAVISGQGISAWVALDNVTVLNAAAVISGQGSSASVAPHNFVALNAAAAETDVAVTAVTAHKAAVAFEAAAAAASPLSGRGFLSLVAFDSFIALAAVVLSGQSIFAVGDLLVLDVAAGAALSRSGVSIETSTLATTDNRTVLGVAAAPIGHGWPFDIAALGPIL